MKPFVPLSVEALRKNLENHPIRRPLDFHIFSEIDSTSRYLKDLPPSDNFSICCAEYQTQGRGRFGRQWIAPFGENICFSARLRLNGCPSRLSGLSLVVSLAVLECLKRNDISETVWIKWPNDLLWHDKKLCGILLETSSDNPSAMTVILGIGLNVNSDTLAQPLADKDWCSLYEMTGHYYDRNQLIADLIMTLELRLDEFVHHGFENFRHRWQASDYLQDRWITVSQTGKSLSGLACGITESGELKLIDAEGIEHHLSSGDTSLRSLS